jgi:LPS sulfotransferase NodH
MEESFSAGGWLFVKRKDKKKQVIAYCQSNQNNFYFIL